MFNPLFNGSASEEFRRISPAHQLALPANVAKLLGTLGFAIDR